MKLLTILAFAAALCVFGSSRSTASPPATTNALTPAEVAEGWILLWDGESTFGWAARGEARWAMHGDTLSPIQGSGRGVLCTTTAFSDFALKADFYVDEIANSGVFVRVPERGEVTSTNAYEVNIFDRHERWPTGSVNDVQRTMVDRPQTAGRWNRMEIIARGGSLRVYVNGERVTQASDGGHLRGVVGLQYNGEGEIRFRNLKLRPLGLKSIFNGKDLAGWQVIPGRKSVFSVTKQGWLNVKDGNGDLQTTRTFGDFVFQLDIISNGTFLNSGVFFRGDAGQFWSGYESQIRNQWEGNDRTRPVDFGTGGIYNQQPTRRVVPNDREWFTKTIVAHGRHMAVWINGIQVSDFTDMRPANTNARQGYREKAGILSIQGHDPTTDLSFRNLRAGEMRR